MKYDIAIVGLGAMGSSALYHATQQGLNVIGIEQFAEVPHHNGSHHGSTRIIRKAYFEDPGYVPLLLRAYELWEALERQTDRKLLAKCGGLMIGSADSSVLSGSMLSAQEHGLPHEMLSAEDVRRRFPAFELDEDQVALFEPDAGYLLAEEAVRAHMEGAIRGGAEVRLGTKVAGWRATEAGVTVELPGEVVHADRLILTVGAWAPEFVPGLPLQVERQVLYWFDADTSQTAGAKALVQSPIYIVEEADGLEFYGFPTLAGEGVKVAMHNGGDICTPGTIDRVVKAEEIDRMRSVLARRMPALAKAPLVKTSTCMYTNTPDLHFVVGPHPNQPNVTLGYSGHGFKFSSVMGEILVGLARGEKTMALPGIFDPKRLG